MNDLWIKADWGDGELTFNSLQVYEQYIAEHGDPATKQVSQAAKRAMIRAELPEHATMSGQMADIVAKLALLIKAQIEAKSKGDRLPVETEFLDSLEGIEFPVEAKGLSMKQAMEPVNEITGVFKTIG